MTAINAHPILFRIGFLIIFFPLMFILPWWLSLCIISLGIFFFKNFYEALIYALLLDGYVGVPHVAFGGTNMFFVTITAVVFIGALFLKLRLKFY